MNKLNGSTREESDEIENWRNEHGSPDFAYLQSLVDADTIESMNKLKSIAEDLDVNYPQNISSGELVDLIRMAVKKNEDGNPKVTN